jgi:hypothetical protein
LCNHARGSCWPGVGGVVFMELPESATDSGAIIPTREADHEGRGEVMKNCTLRLIGVEDGGVPLDDERTAGCDRG